MTTYGYRYTTSDIIRLSPNTSEEYIPITNPIYQIIIAEAEELGLRVNVYYPLANDSIDDQYLRVVYDQRIVIRFHQEIIKLSFYNRQLMISIKYINFTSLKDLIEKYL